MTTPVVRVYAVRWDNGHDCGILPERFTSKTKAEQYARNWKRELVWADKEAWVRADNRRVYQWEIITDVNPSGRAGNSQWAIGK